MNHIGNTDTIGSQNTDLELTSLEVMEIEDATALPELGASTAWACSCCCF